MTGVQRVAVPTALPNGILGVRSEGGGSQYRLLHFHEQGYCVRTIGDEKELKQAYRLRHRVFREELGWLRASPAGLDIDKYDDWATSLGIFSSQCGSHLVATLRLLPPDKPFMLEEEFSELLPLGASLRKECDTTEISRFATLQSSGATEAHTLSVLLYKAWYQWSVLNSVRYVYLEVEARYARKLRMMGFTTCQLGPSRKLPPAYAESVALLLDWDEFRATNSLKRPEFLEWISKAQLVPAAKPRRRRVPLSTLAAYSKRFQHETAPFVR
jgi:acyl homoserine lactone synthase